jgi:hypothetical protein
MALIWRNEFLGRNVPPGPIAADPPPGTIEITRVEQVGSHWHIWYAPVPAVAAAPSDEDRMREVASKTVPAGCTCGWTWLSAADGEVVRTPELRGDCPVHGDEDRIRDAMAEARDHPGRVITR